MAERERMEIRAVLHMGRLVRPVYFPVGINRPSDKELNAVLMKIAVDEDIDPMIEVLKTPIPAGYRINLLTASQFESTGFAGGVLSPIDPNHR